MGGEPAVRHVLGELLDGLYDAMLATAPANAGIDWCTALAEYIRHHDQTLLEGCDRLLWRYQQELLPATSLARCWTCWECWREPEIQTLSCASR